MQAPCSPIKLTLRIKMIILFISVIILIYKSIISTLVKEKYVLLSMVTESVNGSDFQLWLESRAWTSTSGVLSKTNRVTLQERFKRSSSYLYYCHMYPKFSSCCCDDSLLLLRGIFPSMALRNAHRSSIIRNTSCISSRGMLALRPINMSRVPSKGS